MNIMPKHIPKTNFYYYIKKNDKRLATDLYPSNFSDSAPLC